MNLRPLLLCCGLALPLGALAACTSDGQTLETLKSSVVDGDVLLSIGGMT